MIRLAWQSSVKLAGESADEDLFVGASDLELKRRPKYCY